MKLINVSEMSEGPGRDGATLVFVHGFMGGPTDFGPIIDRLGARFRCVCVELAGHGDLGLPGHSLTLKGLADALCEDVLKPLPDPTLIGYSMGGRLALQCALDHPESLANLVLISTSPGIEDRQARRTRRAQDARRAERIRHEFSTFLDDWYRLTIFGNLRRSVGFEAMVARRSQQDPAAIARVITDLSPGCQPSNWPRLGALMTGAPSTTWLVGAEDPKYSRLGEVLAAQGHTVCVGADAAHALHIERPDWVAAQIDSIASAHAPT